MKRIDWAVLITGFGMLVGSIGWLTNTHSLANANSEAIQELKQDNKELSKMIYGEFQKIHRKLGNIEGKLSK